MLTNCSWLTQSLVPVFVSPIPSYQITIFHGAKNSQIGNIKDPNFLRVNTFMLIKTTTKWQFCGQVYKLPNVEGLREFHSNVSL